jgi:DNA-binding CsgD family transcriptional regulator
VDGPGRPGPKVPIGRPSSGVQSRHGEGIVATPLSQQDAGSAAAVAAQVGELSQPAFAVSLDGEVVHWNRSASVLFGIPATQAAARPCWLMVGGRSYTGARLCTPDCPVLAAGAAGAAVPPPLEMLVATRQGRRRSVRVHHLVLKDPAGAPRVLLHLVDDVGERRAAERVGERALALTAAVQADREEVIDVDSVLTRRELEVFLLLAAGQTAREVAQTLGIRHATARTHIQRVLGKLGARNRISALAIALAGVPGRPPD